MTLSRHPGLLKWTAIGFAIAAVGASPVLAGGPPEDPGLPPELLCTVPDVSGLQVKTAKAHISTAKCGRGLTMYRYSVKAKKGLVLSELPEAGTLIKVGTQVDLIVSRGAR